MSYFSQTLMRILTNFSPNVSVGCGQYADTREFSGCVLNNMLYLSGGMIRFCSVYHGYSDVLLEISYTEQTFVLPWIEAPHTTLAKYNNMTRVSRVALLGIGNTPIFTFETWDSTAVKHPSITLLDDIHKSKYSRKPPRIHAQRALPCGFRLYLTLLEQLPELHSSPRKGRCTRYQAL